MSATTPEVLQSRISRKGARRTNSNRGVIDLLLSVTTLVTTCCELALHSTDPQVVEHNLSEAKKSYASMLRYAGRLSFSVRDVQEFELRTIKLEGVIAKLERRYSSGGKPQ
jgi:hypothetical protein